jgi:hypothetical protein
VRVTLIDDSEIADFPPQVLSTLCDIFDTLSAQPGGNGLIPRESLDAYCVKVRSLLFGV